VVRGHVWPGRLLFRGAALAGEDSGGWGACVRALGQRQAGLPARADCGLAARFSCRRRAPRPQAQAKFLPAAFFKCTKPSLEENEDSLTKGARRPGLGTRRQHAQTACFSPANAACSASHLARARSLAAFLFRPSPAGKKKKDDDDDKPAGGGDDCRDLKEAKACRKSKAMCAWCAGKYGGDMCIDEAQAQYLPPMVFECKKSKRDKKGDVADDNDLEVVNKGEAAAPGRGGRGAHRWWAVSAWAAKQ
jgi:hypothetical protein